MSTTIGRTGTGGAVRAALASRAALGALLAIVVTFSQDQGKAHTSVDRDPGFGLVVLGVFLLLQGGILLGFARVVAPGGGGRALVYARAAISAVFGVGALALMGGGLSAMVPLEAASFILLGALELVGVRRIAAAAPGDALFIGLTQVLVGILIALFARDALFAIGVLGMWGAVVAVLLGIAAASTGRSVRP